LNFAEIVGLEVVTVLAGRTGESEVEEANGIRGEGEKE
jgi:hypothetical protein